MSSKVALEVRLFGPARVEASGTAVKLARRATTLTMLALLILRRHQPVSRTFLAFTLFPDYSEEQAHNELRRYLYLVTKALPRCDGSQPWLLVDAETVRWNNDSSAFVDVVAFERLARDDASHAVAVELYAGDLLDDVYDDWVVAERERLRSVYLGMLGQLVERFRSARDYRKAIMYANRLLVADPWREDVLRQLMSIRYASGDSPGALATCDRFTKDLRNELGVAPMPETALLREAIVLGRPLIGSVEHAPIGDGGARAAALPFVGRERERELIHARWDRAARGYGNSLFLGGEAGAGKTRLIGESARIVESEGGRVFCGGTSSPESSPYQCITEALRGALMLLTANPDNKLIVSVLTRVFPELSMAADCAPAIDVLTPERDAARLFGAFGAAVSALALTRPALLILEDLHWASTSTIDAIAMICRQIDRSRVLIVVTYRDEEVSAEHPLRRLLNALGVERRMTDVHLGRLGREDVERLICANAALTHVEPGLVDRLCGSSEGNALFLTEAIADVIERLDATVPHAEHRAIDSIVASRIGRLSEAAQRVAEVAAVCGQGCSVEVVGDVTGFDMTEILRGFDELLDRRLVREAGARDQYDFVFTHNVIRTSIYDRMDEGIRRRRHARIAHVIGKRLAPSDARELARHYEAAGMREAASESYTRAAQQAASLYANDDAVVFAGRALVLTESPARKIEALLIREEANSRLGERRSQASDLAALKDLVSDAAGRCHVQRRIVSLLRSGDDRDAESQALDELRALAAQAGEPRWNGVALIAGAQLHLSVGRYSEAKALALTALPYLEGVSASRDRLQALSMLIEAHVAHGELSDAERLLETVHVLAVATGDRAAECDALMRAVSAATFKQEFPRAACRAREAVALYRVIGDRLGEAHALLSVAMASVRLSQWDEARSANLAAAEICEALGERRGLARATMNLAALHARFGDFHVAREHFRLARAQHELLGDRRARTASLLNESFIAVWQRRPVEAKALASQAVAAAREIHHAAYVATALANLGAAERDLGEIDAAIDHMQEGLSIQMGLNRMADGVSDLADIALAYVARGDLPQAQEFAERIVAIDTSWMETAIFPPYPLWVVACVFRWNADERASAIYTWAWRLSRELAASIGEPALRSQFEALPFHVAMQRIDCERGWPPSPLNRTPHQELEPSRRRHV